MRLDSVFAHNEKWREERLAENPDFFKDLAKGQKPRVLYIGCSDSRVTAEEVIGARPGQVFVHRNIANMVISIDLNTSSVLDYAVDHLRVSDIVVCGHYNCGGIEAAMQPKDLGLLNPWLRNIRDVYRLHSKELNEIPDRDARMRRLSQLNVQEQCINVVKNAFVQRAMKENRLNVHGWIFDISHGKIIDLKIDFDEVLSEIREIYDIRE